VSDTPHVEHKDHSSADLPTTTGVFQAVRDAPPKSSPANNQFLDLDDHATPSGGVAPGSAVETCGGATPTTSGPPSERGQGAQSLVSGPNQEDVVDYLLILLGLVVLGVALAALIRGHLGWAPIPSRKTAGVTLIVGVLLVGIGGALTPQPPSGTAAKSATSTGRSAPSATSTIVTTAPATTANPSSKTPAAGGANTVAAAPGLSDTSVWDTLAQCESGGNWATNTGNGLYGGVQLDQGVWLSNGGGAYAPLPSEATREQQIVIAEKVRAAHGFTPWTSCADNLGLR